MTFTARRTDGRADASSLGRLRRPRDQQQGDGGETQGAAHAASLAGTSPSRNRCYSAAMRLAAAVLVTAACARPAPIAPLPADRAAPLPPLAFPRQDGTPWSSAELAGRPAVIDVWATYCKPCRRSFPQLDRLAADPAISVVGISVDEDDAAVAAFLAEVPASFTIVRDRALAIGEPPLGITRLPTVLVVDAAGRVRWRKDEPTEADYAALPGVIAALDDRTPRDR